MIESPHLLALPILLPLVIISFLFRVTVLALDATPVVKLPTRVISFPIKVSLFPLT